MTCGSRCLGILTLSVSLGTAAQAQDVSRQSILDSAGGASLGRFCFPREGQVCSALRRDCAQFELVLKNTQACRAMAAQQLQAQVVVDAGIHEIDNPNRLPYVVATGIDACLLDPQCNTFLDFKSRYKAAAGVLAVWCAAHLDGWLTRDGAVAAKLVCAAAVADSGQASRFDLEKLRSATQAPTYRCSGPGLMTPVFTLRHPGNGTQVFKSWAGLGAGYYWAMPPKLYGCQEKWTWGIDAFAYTEGLDISKSNYHLAVGSSVGVGFTGLFKFGLGLAYDLIRVDGSAVNGLFSGVPTGYGASSLTYIFTFSVTPSTGGAQPGSNTR